MSIGATAENQAGLIMASIVAFIVVPLLLGGLWLVFRLIGRLFRVPTGLSTLAAGLTIPAVLLAVSLTIDNRAKPLTAQVIDKQQTIKIHFDGYWDNELNLTVRYAPDGAPLPPFRSAAEARLAASGFELATLWPAAADFDRVRPADLIEIRALPFWDGLSLVRLSDQSTATLLPWILIAKIAAGLVLLVIVVRLQGRPIGSTLLVVLFLAAIAYPLIHAYQSWKQHDDLGDATQQVTATVQKVTRITEVSMGIESSRRHYTVPQPYEIVQFTMEIPGSADPILGVDAVDISGNAVSRFDPGASIDVSYASGALRDARILGQTRSHYFLTTFGIYRDSAIYVLAAGVLTTIGAGLKRLIFRG